MRRSPIAKIPRQGGMAGLTGTARKSTDSADRIESTRNAPDRKAGGVLLTEPASGGAGVCLDPSRGDCFPSRLCGGVPVGLAARQFEDWFNRPQTQEISQLFCPWPQRAGRPEGTARLRAGLVCLE